MSTIELGVIRKSPVDEFIADAIAADAKLDAALVVANNALIENMRRHAITRVRNPRVVYGGAKLSQLMTDDEIRTFIAGPRYLEPPKKKRKRR